MRIRLLSALMAMVMMVSLLSGCYEQISDESSEDQAQVSSSSSKTSSKASSSSKPSSSSASSKSNSSSKKPTSSTKVNSAKINSGANISIPELFFASSFISGVVAPPPPIVNKFEPTWLDDYKDFASHGDLILNSLQDMGWTGDKLYENLVTKEGNSSLWPYGAYLEGLGARVSYNEANDIPDNNAIEEYKKALDKVLLYNSNYTTEEYLSLSCYPNHPDYEVYFDDNIWIQKEFMNAYRLFNDEKYLNLAKRSLNYILDKGWDTATLDGGLIWQDMRTSTQIIAKNSCINAPTALACTEMYNITQDEKYLIEAKKIYKWMKEKLMDPSDGLLYDRYDITTEGALLIDVKFTYNTGCFISAAANLYEITGESAYLEDARFSAYGAYFKWLSRGKLAMVGQPLYAYMWMSSNPWFNSSLVQGFIELEKFETAGVTYQLEVERAPQNKDVYVKACMNSLAVACNRKFFTPEGWMNHDWKSTTLDLSYDKEENDVDTDLTWLNQAATARTLFMLQEWSDKN